MCEDVVSNVKFCECYLARFVVNYPMVIILYTFTKYSAVAGQLCLHFGYEMAAHSAWFLILAEIGHVGHLELMNTDLYARTIDTDNPGCFKRLS